MKKWLEILQLLALIIICVVFLFYTYMQKKSDDNLKNIIEKFQVVEVKLDPISTKLKNGDTRYKYFDLSANYYSYSASEAGNNPQPALEAQILNVGGTFGQVDLSIIPWDAENGSLSTSEALWGVVPPEVSKTLFNKVYAKTQMDNMDSLPFDENSSAYHYDDPQFQFGTDNQAVGALLQTADALTQLMVPMLLGHVQLGTAKGMENFAEVSKIKKEARISADVAEKKANKAAEEAGKTVEEAEKAGKEARGPIEDAGQKAAKKAGINSVEDRARNVLEKALGRKGPMKEGKLFSGMGKSIMKKLTTAKMRKVGSGMKKSAKNAWKSAKASVKKALFGAKGAGEGAAKKTLKLLAKQLSKTIIGKAIKGLMIGVVMSMTLAWIPYIGPTLDAIYNFIMTPLLIIMTLPFDWAPITKLTKSLADTDGCCPAGAQALDRAIPAIAEMLISMIPIIGDIFGIIYPYMCMEESGALLPKHKLILPKYLNYQWLSCYHLDWPQYDCTNGDAEVQGKYWDTSSCGEKLVWITDYSIPFVMGYLKSVPTGKWNCGPYTNFNDIVRNPDNHKHTAKRLEGFSPQYDIYNVVPPGTYFFYCDFSDPNMLIQMAQFYYDYATRNPTINEDGTVSIQYITKINYVTSSSLVTCDMLCEMLEVSYNPLDGGDYNEVVTFEHDRRFYFGTDNKKTAPLYWEDSTNAEWRTIDDNFDVAMFALNEIIHSDPFNNFQVNADLLLTSYKQSLESKDLLERATAGGATLNDLYTYTTMYKSSMSNYMEVLCSLYAISADTYRVGNTVTSDISVASNAFNNTYVPIDNLVIFTMVAGEEGSSEAPPAYHVISLTDDNGNQINDPTPIVSGESERTFIERHMDRVLVCSNAYWTYQKSKADPTFNKHTQFILYGCTHIDDTANCAFSPDVSIGEVDARKGVQFDVRPYIKRCTKPHISMRQCMDGYTIDSVVKKYLSDRPTKRIKAITNIEPKGQNVCQYKWDEVDYDATTYVETNYTSKTNNVLFQIDLSSCAFVLPMDENLNAQLYGTTVGGVASQSINTNTATFPGMYLHPTDSSDDLTQYYNPNMKLQYNQTFYYAITLWDDSHKQMAGQVSNTVLMSNVDDIVNYDPDSCLPLPKIVRPQKPIRFHYPKPEETATLGGKSNDVCSLPANLNNFILDYNSHNATSKMLKITRAYTTDAGRCDIEADVMISNVVQRIAHTFDMKLESFVGTPPRYTYDSLDSTYYGLNIQPDTKTTSNLSNTGFLFSKPYVTNVATEVQSNNIYFNDNLIVDFTSKTAGLKNATNKLLVDIVRNDYLGSPKHCYNYNVEVKPKCYDPDIQQRIIEQYNIDNFPKSRYDTKQNSILAMVASATDSSNTCHVVFENEEDKYVDAYSPTSFIYSMSNPYPDPANNYSTENRLFFKEVQMKQLPGTCTFTPVEGQQYIDISASDLALSTQFDIPSLTDGTAVIRPVYPKRKNCQAFCGSNALMINAISNYSTVTGSYIDAVYASMPIGYDTCDYYVHHDVYYSSDGTAKYYDVDGIIRVKYDSPLYYTSDHNCDTQVFKYTSNNYKVQVAGDTVDSSTPDLSPLFSYMIDPQLNDPNNATFKQYVNKNIQIPW